MVDVKGDFRESAKYKPASEGSECWHGLALTLTTGENLSDLLWIVYHQGAHAGLFFPLASPLEMSLFETQPLLYSQRQRSSTERERKDINFGKSSIFSPLVLCFKFDHVHIYIFAKYKLYPTT